MSFYPNTNKLNENNNIKKEENTYYTTYKEENLRTKRNSTEIINIEDKETINKNKFVKGPLEEMDHADHITDNRNIIQKSVNITQIYCSCAECGHKKKEFKY